MSNVLDVEDLCIEAQTGAGSRRILAGVSLAIARGEVLGLVGPSGAGKSTLALAILKLLPAALRMTQGRIRIEGVAIDALTETGMRRLRGGRCGLVVQDPNAALDPLQRIGRQVIETIRSHEAVEAPQARARAAAALSAAGVDDVARLLASYPHQLSGGMRQRAAIGLALCADPALLIADEPVSNVDVALRAAILDRLKQLARERGLAILLITHDLAAVAAAADRIAVLEGGAIVECGAVRAVLGRPRQPVTRALLGAIAHRPRRAPIAAVTEANGDDAGRRHSALVRVRQWLDAGGRRGAVGSPLLRVEALRKTFRGAGPFGLARAIVAVDGVSFALDRGETFGIVGESGSGKSTLGRLIAGLEAASGGRVVIEGRPVSPKALRRQRPPDRWPVQMVFQDPAGALNPRLTAGEAIGEMIRIAAPRASGGDVESLMRALLVCVGLPAEAAGKPPRAFSGGEKQRVVLARALAAQPRLLICDEPTSALDLVTQARILDLLAWLGAGLGLAVLFISHDLSAVQRLSRRVGVMRAGRLCEVAEAAELFTAPRHPYTRRLVSLLRENSRSLAAMQADPVDGAGVSVEKGARGP